MLVALFPPGGGWISEAPAGSRGQLRVFGVEAQEVRTAGAVWRPGAADRAELPCGRRHGSVAIPQPLLIKPQDTAGSTCAYTRVCVHAWG